MKNVTPLTHRNSIDIDILPSTNSTCTCTNHNVSHLANQIGDAVILLLAAHMPDIYSQTDMDMAIKKDLLWSTVFEIVYSHELSKIKDKPRQLRSRISVMRKNIEKLNKQINALPAPKKVYTATVLKTSDIHRQKVAELKKTIKTK